MHRGEVWCAVVWCCVVWRVVVQYGVLLRTGVAQVAVLRGARVTFAGNCRPRNKDGYASGRVFRNGAELTQ